jgi:hypothetical protein
MGVGVSPQDKTLKRHRSARGATSLVKKIYGHPGRQTDRPTDRQTSRPTAGQPSLLVRQGLPSAEMCPITTRLALGCVANHPARNLLIPSHPRKAVKLDSEEVSTSAHHFLCARLHPTSSSIAQADAVESHIKFTLAGAM